MKLRAFGPSVLFLTVMGMPIIAHATTGAPTHVHYCGCGHPGYVAPACLNPSSTSSGATSSTTSSASSSSTTSSSTTSASSSGSSASSSGSTSSSGSPVPEPADFALFALGVAGLVFGQRIAHRAKREQLARHAADANNTTDI